MHGEVGQTNEIMIKEYILIEVAVVSSLYSVLHYASHIWKNILGTSCRIQSNFLSDQHFLHELEIIY
jgi:hypothetical protein